MCVCGGGGQVSPFTCQAFAQMSPCQGVSLQNNQRSCDSALMIVVSWLFAPPWVRDILFQFSSWMPRYTGGLQGKSRIVDYSNTQLRSQTLNLVWAGEEHIFLVLPHIIFSHFPLSPHFPPLVGRLVTTELDTIRRMCSRFHFLFKYITLSGVRTKLYTSIYTMYYIIVFTAACFKYYNCMVLTKW